MDHNLFLMNQWYLLNKKHFGGVMEMPVIYADPDLKANGIYDMIFNEIAINERLFVGDEGTELLPGPKHEENRLLYIQDVLLHEITHQYVYLVKKLPHKEDGHGELFCQECNRISDDLGLRRVFLKSENHILSCNEWPHNVRVDYGEAYNHTEILKKSIYLSLLSSMMDQSICLKCGNHGPFKGKDGKLLFLFCEPCDSALSVEQEKDIIDDNIILKINEMKGIINGKKVSSN